MLEMLFFVLLVIALALALIALFEYAGRTSPLVWSVVILAAVMLFLNRGLVT